MSIRQLRTGELLPPGQPRRYKAGHGYIRLRWRLGSGDYVEVYEHRVVNGRVTSAEEVHHKNRVRDDNQPENLQPLTAQEHRALHAPPWVAEAVRLYQEGIALPALARRFGVPHQTVNAALRLRGVQMRRSWDYCRPVDHAELRRLHGLGVRASRIATVLGVGVLRVNRAMDDLGLPRFRPGRPPSNGQVT